jgi:hypothetical protein
MKDQVDVRRLEWDGMGALSGWKDVIGLAKRPFNCN